MIITIEELDTYTQNHEDSPDAVNMKETLISAAEDIVTTYLGYDPELQERTEYVSGLGLDFCTVGAMPVTAISSITMDGTTTESPEFRAKGNLVTFIDRTLTAGYENVKIVYTAGWDVDSIPSAIKSATLEIAGLKLQESNGNIGLTSRSLGDNTRTFVNYSNYDKHLKNIAQYKAGIR